MNRTAAQALDEAAALQRRLQAETERVRAEFVARMQSIRAEMYAGADVIRAERDRAIRVAADGGATPAEIARSLGFSARWARQIVNAPRA